MNRRRQSYSRDPREWAEFFGTWILLAIIWVVSLSFMGFVAKIMWRIFMWGWDLV